MATGPKRHFINQYLLKQFSTGKKGKERVNVYSKKFGFLANQSTINVAAERNFYEDDVDENITLYESNTLNNLIDKICSKVHMEAVASEDAAEIIGHYSVRGKSIRNLLLKGANQFFDELSNQISEPKNLKKKLGINHHQPSKEFLKAINELIPRIPKINGFKIPDRTIRRVFYLKLREMWDEEINPNLFMILDILNSKSDEIPQMVDDSHNRALTESLAPEGRKYFLRQLQWKVIETETKLILPDCVVLAETKDSNEIISIMGIDNDQVSRILMPISNYKVLIGTINDNFQIDEQSFNENSIGACEEFFIFSEDSAELKENIQYIGNKSERTFNESIPKIFEEIFEKYHSTEVKKERLIDDDVDVIKSYYVKFNGFPDDFEFKIISDEVHAIFKALAEEMPFSILGGLVFTFSPISDIEAEYPDLEMEQIRREKDFHFCQLYKYDSGKPVGEIYLSGNYAYALIGNDEKDSRAAYAALVRTLSSLYAHQVFWDVYSRDYVRLNNDPIDTLFFSKLSSIWDAYYSRRVVTNISSDSVEYFTRELSEQLKLCRQELLQQRLDYRFHGNIGKFLEISITPIIKLLSSAAELIAFCRSKKIEISDQLLKQIHNADELDGLAWLKVLSDDLENIFENTQDIKAYAALISYVEKLYFLHQIYFAVSENCEIRVEVPLFSDNPVLAKESISRFWNKLTSPLKRLFRKQ